MKDVKEKIEINNEDKTKKKVSADAGSVESEVMDVDDGKTLDILNFRTESPATHPIHDDEADNGDGAPQQHSDQLGGRDKRISKRQTFRYAWARLWYFFFRQTSPVHRQDAKEKYWILWRELETAMYAKAIDLGFSSYSGFKDKTSQEVEKVISEFKIFSSNRSGDLTKVQAFGNLLLYARILSKQPLPMLNKAETLNMMWRDITFVRSRLLTDAGVISDERLPAQLEYCRLEWSKVCPSKEAGLEEMLHDTALELVSMEGHDPSNSETKTENNHKARRTLATILAKLNHIRLNDINSQLRIKKVYNVAFFVLLFLSVLLLHLNERLTNQFVPYWVAYDQFVATFDWLAPNTWVEAPMDFAIYMLQNNLLFYIFFAGLLGGFFSTVMKLRSKEVNIGDVYLRSYLLTKPIVGALGATILYIIIKSNIVALDLGQLQIIDQISKNSYMFGPLGFSFGFLMGFSERIIMPTVSTESSKQ